MATAVKQTISEHDCVELTKPIDKDETLTRDPGEPRGIGQWPAGTRGAVISDYDDHKLVEIMDEDGVTLDIVTVPIEKLRLRAKHSH